MNKMKGEIYNNFRCKSNFFLIFPKIETCNCLYFDAHKKKVILRDTEKQMQKNLLEISRFQKVNAKV